MTKPEIGPNGNEMLVDIVDGMETYLGFDESDGKAYLRTAIDVEPIIERNKALQNSDGAGWSPTREWKHVAEVPLGVVLQWKQDLGVDVFDKNHMPRVIRLLNDPEWRYLRVGSGMIGGGH